MQFSGGAVDASLLVGSITSEGGKWACDLVEQEFDLGDIFGIMGRQL